MGAMAVLMNEPDSLSEKIVFLSSPSTYGDTRNVDIKETHMSWVFLTDHYVYKLKKPVIRSYLDFGTAALRRKYCLAEVQINAALGGDTYLEVIALTLSNGRLELNGSGNVVDWIVKMKRLPEESMLDTIIKQERIDSAKVQVAAEKIADFYCTSKSCRLTMEEFSNRILSDIKCDAAALVGNQFNVWHSAVSSIVRNLICFVEKSANLFSNRISKGRIIDCHGDLRPEHICLGTEPLIIDRLEFNDRLRIMDVAEELSFLALECEVLSALEVGQQFISVYEQRSGDVIPEELIDFYKGKRALLRANLSINHLKEKRYISEKGKWQARCETYLNLATSYCTKISIDQR